MTDVVGSSRPALFGRSLGLDLGAARIGVAVGDVSGTLASPLTVLRRSGSRRLDHQAIADLAGDEDVVRIVVGLPLNMDGSAGSAAQAARSEADALASVVDVPVLMIDERRTTSTAAGQMAASGRNAKQRKAMIDAAAATVILQHWLDGQVRP